MSLLNQAINIRQDFEGGNVPESILVDLYTKYADIEDPQLFVQRAKKIFPKGNCGLATLYLKKALDIGEIIQGKYAEESHTFLLIGDQVIDITADQYDGPKVYVGPLVAPWSK